MLYFIPAWYKNQTWNENEQQWYIRRAKSEFDETIKQITLFHRNVKLDYQVMVLAYSPNLRHFLHRQGMYRATCWSCFDAIAQIRRKKMVVFSYHDVMWPSGVEFFNSAFAVLAFIKGEKYAKVEFGEDGNPISIDLYQNQVICRRNYYDDRGFVSSTVLFQNGKEAYQDFLMENGVWKIRHVFQNGHVLVNPECPRYDLEENGSIHEINFQKSEYESMAELIKEVLTEYVKRAAKEDQFFVAAHPLHMNVLEQCLEGKRTIITFFEERYPFEDISGIVPFLSRAENIITDSVKTSRDIQKEAGGAKLNVTDISPYDTRLDLGISRQLKVQNILIPVDGIDKENFQKIMLQVASYLTTNEYARVHLFSRNTSLDNNERLRNELADFLQSNGYDRRWVVEEQDESDESSKEPVRIMMDVCVDERLISKCINEQRVILDLRKKMDVFLYITAISKGVPRISMRLDQYFDHLKNGYLIYNYEQIPKALAYYLESFENWNQALINCYEIGQKYTTEVLLRSWRKVLGISE